MLYQAKLESPQKGFRFLSRNNETFVSFEELWKRANVYAEQLADLGVSKGDSVIILLQTGPTFSYCYFATQLLGASCCVLPGVQGTDVDKYIRLARASNTLSTKLIISEKKLEIPAEFDVLAKCISLEEIEDNLDKPEDFIVDTNSSTENDIAIIQATSGSTGEPKCIALSHQNALSNLWQIGTRLETTKEDIGVSWLPLFHDMGLFSSFLFPIFWQIDCVLMTPMHFLRRPNSWLQAVSDYKGTLIAAPNFAFNLVTEKVKDSDIKKLDLSSLRMAMCGAEPIRFETVEAFSERYASSGLRQNIIVPSYGLAEASVCVSLHSPSQVLKVEQLSRDDLSQKSKAVVTDGEESSSVVSCGKAVDGTEISIVDDNGHVLDDGYVGEVWVRSPSVMQAYVGLDILNSQVIANEWLKTGDYGYLRDGELFVTGRKKEIIIIRGHNYTPSDIEWVAGEVEGVLDDKVVAFGIDDDVTVTEHLVIAFERNRKKRKDTPDEHIADDVKLHVSKKLGLIPHKVVVLPKNTITKTTSGKLQRTLVKARFEEEALSVDNQVLS